MWRPVNALRHYIYSGFLWDAQSQAVAPNAERFLLNPFKNKTLRAQKRISLSEENYSARAHRGFFL
jgi:hypothetical protein